MMAHSLGAGGHGENVSTPVSLPVSASGLDPADEEHAATATSTATIERAAITRVDSARKRLAQLGQACSGLGIARAALHRLVELGNRLGAVDVADGARGETARDRMHGGLEQIRKHLRVAARG